MRGHVALATTQRFSSPSGVLRKSQSNGNLHDRLCSLSVKLSVLMDLLACFRRGPKADARRRLRHSRRSRRHVRSKQIC